MSDTSGSAQHNEAARVSSDPEQMTDRRSGNPQRVRAAVANAVARSSPEFSLRLVRLILPEAAKVFGYRPLMNYSNTIGWWGLDNYIGLPSGPRRRVSKTVEGLRPTSISL